jgi:hypothetical protein
MQKNLPKLLEIMEKKINMPNSDNKFKFVQERIETDKVVALPNIVVASHSLISLRNIPSIYLLEAIGIAAMQKKLNISFERDIIRYADGHLTKALEFIEKSIIQN